MSALYPKPNSTVYVRGPEGPSEVTVSTWWVFHQDAFHSRREFHEKYQGNARKGAAMYYEFNEAEGVRVNGKFVFSSWDHANAPLVTALPGDWEPISREDAKYVDRLQFDRNEKGLT